MRVASRYAARIRHIPGDLMSRWPDVFDRSVVLSLCSLTVAVIILAVAISSNLNFQSTQQLNNEPVLNTGGPIFSPPTSVSFVANRGRGVAIVDDIKVIYGDTIIKMSDIRPQFDQYQNIYNQLNSGRLRCTIDAGKYYKGMRIDPDQRVTLFTTEGDCPLDMYMGFLSGLTIEFT